MLPDWNCANPLTANSRVHKAARTTANNLGVGHRFIAAPFIKITGTRVQKVGRGATIRQTRAGQAVTSLVHETVRVGNSTTRFDAYRSLNRPPARERPE